MKKKLLCLFLALTLLLLTGCMSPRTLLRRVREEFTKKPAPTLTEEQTQAVPIFMYHAVSDDVWGVEHLFVSPSEMEKQLAYLSENGYTTIFFDDLSHAEDFEKPVLLTFDDGYDDNYTELYPLLQKYNAKATIFMIANDLGIHHKMTQEQMAELSRSGLVSIQSHTYSHQPLATLDADTQDYEMRESQSALEEMTGVKPTVISFPNGSFNEDTLRLAKQYYTWAVTTNHAVYYLGTDPYKMNRFAVKRETTLDEFAQFCAYAG